MAKNLFDFGNETFTDDEDLKQFENKLNENENTKNAKEIYEKYKDYSKEDLLAEFLNVSKRKLKSGELTREKLNQTINGLMPFVNSNQANFLKGLIDKIDE